MRSNDIWWALSGWISKTFKDGCSTGTLANLFPLFQPDITAVFNQTSLLSHSLFTKAVTQPVPSQQHFSPLADLHTSKLSEVSLVPVLMLIRVLLDQMSALWQDGRDFVSTYWIALLNSCCLSLPALLYAPLLGHWEAPCLAKQAFYCCWMMSCH